MITPPLKWREAHLTFPATHPRSSPSGGERYLPAREGEMIFHDDREAAWHPAMRWAFMAVVLVAAIGTLALVAL
jgi:hypothetical protein